MNQSKPLTPAYIVWSCHGRKDTGLRFVATLCNLCNLCAPGDSKNVNGLGGETPSEDGYVEVLSASVWNFLVTFDLGGITTFRERERQKPCRAPESGRGPTLGSQERSGNTGSCRRLFLGRAGRVSACEGRNQRHVGLLRRRLEHRRI